MKSSEKMRFLFFFFCGVSLAVSGGPLLGVTSLSQPVSSTTNVCSEFVSLSAYNQNISKTASCDAGFPGASQTPIDVVRPMIIAASVPSNASWAGIEQYSDASCQSFTGLAMFKIGSCYPHSLISSFKYEVVDGVLVYYMFGTEFGGPGSTSKCAGSSTRTYPYADLTKSGCQVNPQTRGPGYYTVQFVNMVAPVAPAPSATPQASSTPNGTNTGAAKSASGVLAFSPLAIAIALL